MSVEATRFVWEVDLSEYKKRSTKRLVLLSLADRANKQGICFPSVARISEDTCLDRKTVISTIQDLISMNILVDTGERKGATMQVRVLQVNMSFKANVVIVVKDKEESDTFVPKQPKEAVQSCGTFIDDISIKDISISEVLFENVNTSKVSISSNTVRVKGDYEANSKATCFEDLKPEITITTSKHNTKLDQSWIPKHEYAKKMKEQRELEKNNQEFIVPQSMRASWEEGFTRDTKEVVKGIPKGLLSDPRIARMFKHKR